MAESDLAAIAAELIRSSRPAVWRTKKSSSSGRWPVDSYSRGLARNSDCCRASCVESSTLLGRDTDDPAAEAHLAVQTRPAQIPDVVTARVADVDAVLVVADADEPVPMPKPGVAVHEQRALVQPGLQIGTGAEGPLPRRARSE